MPHDDPGQSLHPRTRRRWATDLARTRAGEGATRQQIAMEIAARLKVTPLAAFRLSHGLTQADAAARYNQHWPEDPPKTPKVIARWERWQGPGAPVPAEARTPPLVALRRFAALYHCTVDDLLIPAGDAHQAGKPGSTQAPTPAPTTTVPLAPGHAGEGNSEGDATNRRQALRATTLATFSSWISGSDLLNIGTVDAGSRVGEPVLAAIAATVATAQRLDDAGSNARGYVTDQAHAVNRMLRRDHYDAATGRELAARLAQLAQTAGFMHYDAGLDPAARRWYELGLQAADHAGDRPMRASLLSLMSNQAASCGRTAEALGMAHAARRVATNAPPTVRALVAARSSLAYAATGDLTGLRNAEQATHRYLAAPPEPSPSWAYYVNGTELKAILGRAMAALARRKPHRRLILDAQKFLHSRAFADDTCQQRSELRHGTWLALMFLQADEPDQAIITGRHCLDTGRRVTSPRIFRLLHQLRTDFAPYAGHADAPAFLEQLDQFLAPAHPTTLRARSMP